MIPGIILFLESLGGGELVLILLFVLMFFGSKNIPSLARGLGKGIREFKDAMSGVQSEIKQGMYEIEKQGNALISEEKPKVIEPAPVAESTPLKVESTPSEVDSTAKSENPIAAVLPEIKPEDRSAAR